jgi:hypothetical protein
VQETEVFEADYCDKHATDKQAREWVEKEYRFQGTIFDRGDGKADFKKG